MTVENIIEYDINFNLLSGYDKNKIDNLLKLLLEKYGELEISYSNMNDSEFYNLYNIDYNITTIYIKKGDNIDINNLYLLRIVIVDTNYEDLQIIINPTGDGTKSVNIRVAYEFSIKNYEFSFCKVSPLLYQVLNLLDPDIVTLGSFCTPVSLEDIKNGEIICDYLYLNKNYVEYINIKEYDSIILNTGILFFINRF